MNMHRKPLTFLALVMALIFAMPGGSWAGGGRYGDGGYGHGYGYGYHGYSNGHCYPNYYHGNYYHGGQYYYPHYYPCTTCGNNHHHNNNNNDNDKLWIGLLGGGILGYTLGNIQQGY
jgi:hypothetical protein